MRRPAVFNRVLRPGIAGDWAGRDRGAFVRRRFDRQWQCILPAWLWIVTGGLFRQYPALARRRFQGPAQATAGHGLVASDLYRARQR